MFNLFHDRITLRSNTSNNFKVGTPCRLIPSDAAAAFNTCRVAHLDLTLEIQIGEFHIMCNEGAIFKIDGYLRNNEQNPSFSGV